MYKIGQMVPNMWEIGRMIEQTEKVNCIMDQATYMKDNGKMIKHMDKELIIKKMGGNTWGNGMKINNMDLEKKHFLMDQSTKASLTTVLRMEKG